MYARKKTGPRPLPLRDLSVQRALAPVATTSTLARSAALVLAATSMLACSAGLRSDGVDTVPTACERLAGAVTVTPPLPTASSSATTPPVATTPPAPTTTPQPIMPDPDPPELAGDVAPARR